jgi:type IV pilus assembly protein PilM
MDNPLKKFFAGFKLFGASHDDSVVGIDIGSSSIKVVQIKKKGGKAVLETYGALALGPYIENGAVGQVTNLTADKLAPALADVIRESGVTTKNAILSIPSAASLIFTLELPATVVEKEFATIVPTEARKYIPVPINEVALDWLVIPKSPEQESDTVQKTEVLVTAIHNDTIAKYNDIFKNAALEPSPFEIEIFSTIRSVLTHELGSVLLIDLGASKTKLTIVDRGIVRVFHAINRGASDITNSLSVALGIPFAKAEQMKQEMGMAAGATDQVSTIIRESFDYIVSETNGVVLAYEKKYNKAIGKIVLTGGGALVPGFVEFATNQFHSEVVLANPFAKTEVPTFLEDVLAKIGPEFSVAIGLALRKLQ